MNKKVIFILLVVIIVCAIFSVIYIIYNGKKGTNNIDVTGYILSSSNNDIDSVLMDKKIDSFYMKLSSKKDNNNVKITITGKNIFSGQFDNGFIDAKQNNLELIDNKNSNFRTTKWIEVPQSAKYVTMSGDGFNRAVWQVKLKNGKVISSSENINYRSKDVIWSNKSSATLELPEDAVSFRVYYAKLDDSNCLEIGDKLQIEIGAICTSYEKYSEESVDILIGKNETVTFDGNLWKKEGSEEIVELKSLTINQKSIINLQSSYNSNIEININENINQNVDKSKIYGVSFEEDGSVICQREEDSKDFNTNYRIDNSFATPYKNDFDYAYPWSEMRVCNVLQDSDGNRKVIYEDDVEFSKSQFDVMVEIPKYYYKREKVQDKQYIYISGVKHEGFEIEPAFLKDGIELDKVYVAAYLSSIDESGIYSKTGEFPCINISLNDVNDLSSGTIKREIDILSIFMLQKLFIVENAVIDSQCIYSGNTDLKYFDYSLKGAGVAKTTISNSNSIILKNTYTMKKLNIGDSVCILNSVDEWNNFENIVGKFQRQIIDKKVDSENVTITFSGDPIDITENVTQIFSLPKKNGETDDINYHSGYHGNKISGINSFKYRNIENLYGSVFVILDKNAYVKNSELYIIYGESVVKKLNFKLANQPKMITINSKASGMSIRTMGLDEENSYAIMPEKVGASTSSYYSDFFYLGTEKDKEYIIVYGGTWDNSSAAGIFSMRGFETENDRRNANGSRLIIK